MTDTTTLFGFKANDTYHQLLFVEGGITSTRKVIRSGLGIASALFVDDDSISIGNLLLGGSAGTNGISVLDTDGDLTLRGNGTGVVDIEDVAIVGGTISSLDTPLAVADGGSGATDATTARTNFGLGTISTQASDNVTITGGTLSNLTGVTSTTLNSTVSMGFVTGAGGTQTQGTSKSTTVVLNKACGKITMHNATLNAATSVGFTFTNSEISSSADVIVVNIASGATADSYVVGVDAVAAGSCRIHLRNISAGNLGEAVVLNFAVIRGVVA